MKKSAMTARRKTDREIIILEYLKHVCVRLGYCLPPNVQADLASTQIESPEKFVERIMREDGINPESFPDHFQTMLEMLKNVLEMPEYKETS